LAAGVCSGDDVTNFCNYGNSKTVNAPYIFGNLTFIPYVFKMSIFTTFKNLHLAENNFHKFIYEFLGKT